jgi:hypothetical protein
MLATAPNMFKPGQSGNPGGRPKKLLKRVDEMCHADGKHPYTELMRLLPELKEREQAEIWLQLLSYCQARPKQLTLDDDDDEIKNLKNLSMKELMRLVKDNLPGDEK